MNRFKNIFKDKNWWTVSNFLTIGRILLTPFIVINIYKMEWTKAFILFAISALTDLFDGFLARYLNQETYLGKLLDPIADKLLLISVFTSLAFLNSPLYAIPGWFVFLLLMREFAILLGSFFLMNKNIQFRVQPTIWGKATTLFQCLFISWIFICSFMGWAPAKTYYILLILITIFSVVAFLQYVKIGFKYLFLFILFFMNLNLFADNFVITETKNNKNSSKAEIKEDIGLSIKENLNNLSELNKKIGEINKIIGDLQIQIAEIQKNMFSKVEGIIDNDKPFKKASRGQLGTSLGLVQNINIKLKTQLDAINKIKEDLNKDFCLKS